MILCDTGPLVAAAVQSDGNHDVCIEMFAGLRLDQERILVPPTVIAEAGYMIERLGDPSRLGVTEIATLDRRHFTIVRPSHVSTFRLLPEYA